MARLLLNTTTHTNASLDSRASVAPQVQSLAALETRLRQPRSQAYVASFTQLDSGGHICDRHALDRLMEALAKEFPDIAIEQYPLGILGKCYLEPPHEVHTFAPTGSIIRHYKTYESLPGQMEQARSLALNPAYACVEIYTDKMIAIAKSGTTAVIPFQNSSS